MKVVLQVVSEASVSIENEIVSRIGKGFLLLVGFTEGDDLRVASKMADKILKLRLFPDENGKTNLGLSAVDGELLCVSQFTLYGSVKEGNRPSFVGAMRPDDAKALYDAFCLDLKSKFTKTQFGVFQADMKVSLVNDGPFTLVLDSKELIRP